MRKADYFGKSDLGRIRTNNEDSFLICRIWDEDHILAVVIDGVGGYEGGEVAAELARTSIQQYLKDNPQGDCLELLKQAVITANNKIFQERNLDSQLANMSCVLTASIIELDTMRVNIAHVGDTRIYQYSSSRLEKLSHDHSLIGYREEIGDLTEEEAMNHPQRNIISRDVGSGFLDESENSYVEVASYPLENKTQLLLCSDGLCDMVTSAEMVQILSQPVPVEAKVEKLIDAALKAGGKDNVTVVVVDVESDEIDVDENHADETDLHINDEEPEVPIQKTSGGKTLGRLLSWLVPLIFICGFAAGIFMRPVLIPERASECKEDIEKISADSVDTVSADTTGSKAQQDTTSASQLEQANA